MTRKATITILILSALVSATCAAATALLYVGG